MMRINAGHSTTGIDDQGSGPFGGRRYAPRRQIVSLDPLICT